MKSNFQLYEYLKSFDRLDDILAENDVSYEEVDAIPSRDKLTFTNGFYINCSAMFVDIRDSSSFPDKYKRPTLAKLYRSYASEVTAVMNGNSDCAEVNIVGDCVSGIFNSQLKIQIDSIFCTAATIWSLIKVFNYKLEKLKVDPISVGIGLSYGRALMIKAGYSGSGINEVVWTGDVVNDASHLAGYGSATYQDLPLMVSSAFYNNLNEHNSSLLRYNSSRGCYHGNVIIIGMEEWFTANCK